MAVHVPASEHALEIARREQENTERITREGELARAQRALDKRIALEENAKALSVTPRVRGPKNTRVEALIDLPSSFTASKSVIDMHYCVCGESE